MGNKEGPRTTNVKVAVRVRPPNEREEYQGNVLRVNGNSITMQSKHKHPFTFDHVFDQNTAQEHIFRTIGKPTADNAMAGYNSTVFAYGQTGSGKTFTMQGPSADACSDDDMQLYRGLIPRVFEHLFAKIGRSRRRSKDAKDVEYMCKVSYVEIYNEKVYDLLDNSAATSHLALRETYDKGVYLEGVREYAVETPRETYEVLLMGSRNRHTGSTTMNRESSRSHSVFTITIESKETDDGITNIRRSRLNLVDLAGSERQKSTNARGQQLKEANKINQSLSTLGLVISSLVDKAEGKKTVHIPYRDSKLTYLLRDSLGGNSMTTIIGTVSPSDKWTSETLSTLRFANRAKKIRNKVRVNENTTGDLARLQREVQRLRAALAQAEAHAPDTSGATTTTTVVANPEAIAAAEQRIMDLERLLVQAADLQAAHDRKRAELQAKLEHRNAVLEKHAKALQQKKMERKFMQKRIDALSRGPPHHLDRDEVYEVLRKELAEAHKFAEHNPKLVELAAQNRELRLDMDEMRETYLAVVEERDEKMDQIQKFCTELSAQISQLVVEKHTLAAQGGGVSSELLEQAETEKFKMMEELAQEIEALQAKVEESNAAAQRSTERAEQLQASMVDATNMATAMKEESEALRATIESQRAQLRTFEQQQTRQLADADERVQQLQARVEQVQEERNTLQQRTAGDSVKLSELRAIVAQRDETLRENSSKHAAAEMMWRERVGQAQSEMKCAAETHAGELAKLRAEHTAALKDAQESAELDVLEVEQKLQQTTHDLEMAQSKLSSVTEETKLRIEDAESRLEQYEEEITQTRSVAEELREENQRLAIELEKHLDARAKLAADGRQELQRALSDAETARAELATLHEAHQASSSELAHVRGELDTASQRLDERSRELAEARGELHEQTSEMERVRADLDEMAALKEAAEGEVSALRDSVKELKRQRERAMGARPAFSTPNGRSDTFVSAQLKVLEEENKQLREEVRQSHLANDTATKQVAHLRATRTPQDNARIGKLEDELRHSLREKMELHREMQQLRAEEKERYEQAQEAESALRGCMEQLHTALEERDRVRKERDKLKEVNNRLTGHKNLQQKIHFHQKIKEENNALLATNEELAKQKESLASKLSKVQARLARAEKANGVRANYEREEELEEQLAAKEREIDEMQRSMAVFAADVLRSGEKKKKMHAVSDEAEGDVLAQGRTKFAAMASELEDKKREIRLLTERVRSLERDGELRAQAERLLTPSASAKRMSASGVVSPAPAPAPAVSTPASASRGMASAVKSAMKSAVKSVVKSSKKKRKSPVVAAGGKRAKKSAAVATARTPAKTRGSTVATRKTLFSASAKKKKKAKTPARRVTRGMLQKEKRKAGKEQVENTNAATASALKRLFGSSSADAAAAAAMAATGTGTKRTRRTRRG